MLRSGVGELGLGEVAGWQGWEVPEALQAGKVVFHPVLDPEPWAPPFLLQSPPLYSG